jgi:hypothetical protein
MRRIGRESLKYTIDFQHPPLLEVELGESFTLGTEDAPSGLYRSLDDAKDYRLSCCSGTSATASWLSPTAITAYAQSTHLMRMP